MIRACYIYITLALTRRAALTFRGLQFFAQSVIWHILYTVSHFSYAQLFQSPNFWQKCWNRTFSMIIYVLTFCLFDDVKKISESLMRITLLRRRQFWQKVHVQPEPQYFLFTFCARHYPWWSFCQKNTKKIILFKYNYFFRPLNLVTVLLYEEILVLTSFWRQLQ